MYSTKIIVCELLVFFITYAFTENNETMSSTTSETYKNNCLCGGFPTETITPDSVPTLSQSPGLFIKCDNQSFETCKNLCNALAIAAKAKGPEVICSRIGNATELKLSAFYKACDQPWLYAGLTAVTPICCEDSKPKLCPSMAENNATMEADTIVQ